MTKSISCKKDKIRKKIDSIDRFLIDRLEKRFFYISQLKSEKKTLTDKKREEEILSKISNTFIQEIYKAIFKSSKKMLKKMKG